MTSKPTSTDRPADPNTELGLWRPGPTLDAIVAFLDRVGEIPPHDRVAVFDNDGTLWVERPGYTQAAFISWAVAERADRDPDYHPPALLADLQGANFGDRSVDEVAAAVNDVFADLTPEEFTAKARRFITTWRNPELDRAPLDLRYRPMLQLMTALEGRGFSIFLVTGGGADFVRSLAWDFYGVPPERVVGSLVEYRYLSDPPGLTRGVQLVGPPNEGAEKVSRLHQMLGRRPVFAAGNSAGDAEMLAFTAAGDGPTLALLVDHDDQEREFAYRSVSASLAENRDIVDIGRDEGWTIVSVSDDWARVFD
ncbi:MAG: HAD family hydrolase [Acidimicrobiales bacterium]